MLPSGPRQVGSCTFEQMLHRTGERARRGHRLVDLVRQRRGHAADQAEARGAGGFGFLLAQSFFGKLHQLRRLLALADNRADHQSGAGQHQHQGLHLGEGLRVIAETMHQPDQRELRDGKRDTGAVEAVPHGGEHHRHEQEIEIFQAAGARRCRTMIQSAAQASAP